MRVGVWVHLSLTGQMFVCVCVCVCVYVCVTSLPVWLAERELPVANHDWLIEAVAAGTLSGTHIIHSLFRHTLTIISVAFCCPSIHHYHYIYLYIKVKFIKENNMYFPSGLLSNFKTICIGYDNLKCLLTRLPKGVTLIFIQIESVIEPNQK